MFGNLITQLVGQSSMVAQRTEGVAFFRTAKDLYRLASITYVCVNISAVLSRNRYAHCFYSDTCVKQFISRTPLQLDYTSQGGLLAEQGRSQPPRNLHNGAEKPFGLTLSLLQRCGETAVFGITVDMPFAEWKAQEKTITRECQILANYFHGHVLRINGCDSEQELLISARELDCLKWTAAGKTAWEASVILGISERTVRFHLNVAREKLNCSTTTQAVAKAVAHQLIDI
jgi:DNA-binding CsgD family transcriptional regulator